MKFGILEYKNQNVINIGDGMQILSVLELYEHMGIKKEEIVRINYFDLQTYDEEEVVLPICLPFYGYNQDNRITCFSPKIRPVFLSLSLFDIGLEEDEVLYLKQFEPIGCRDEFTADGLAKKGIRTYLNGCMTLTLNAKKRNPSAQKIYAIDLPQEFIDYIPAEFKNKLVFRTSIFKSIPMRLDEYARSLLDEYADQAKLVITSRLHAAVPCYAVGIPVIFIHTEYSYRFSWLEDILHVYLPEEWCRIDWYGKCIEANEKALLVRKLMMEIARARLVSPEVNCKINMLQSIYNERERRKYVRGPMEVAVRYIKEHWRGDDAIEYAVWGLGQVACGLIEYIREYYPQAVCVAAIDAVKTKEFKGILPKRIKDVNLKNIFVFVTADAVNPYALSYFQEIGKDPSEYLFLWKHINLPIKELKRIM